MRYEEHAPPAAVAAHVACLWTLTGAARPTPAGAAVALDHGFYDQAHFIAEFRAFAGDAPRRFVEHRLAELTRFFVDRRTPP